ncbi:MAG TPA: hypothetical protein PKD51_01220 [Saprospiraceae bacterium]|nr:hypothetical protein [Saprospiraceae bacterium]
MNRTILLILLLWFSYFSNAQIVIAPEAGIYYRPYRWNVQSNGVIQKKIEFYIGMMGEVKLMPKIYAQTRMTYVFKDRVESGEVRTFPIDLQNASLTNKELTFNVDVLYEPIKNSKIGLGLGMIHKLSSQVEENFYYKDSRISYFSPNILYNASVVVNHNWGRFGLNFRYFYLFKSEYIDTYYSAIINDKSGITMGFNYKLLGYKKQK